MTEAAIETRHGADCDCTRCRGFEPGHTLSRRHGAFVKHLQPDDVAEIEELVEWMLERVPDQHDADEFAIVTMARTEWRKRKLEAYLAEHGAVRDGEGVRSLLRHIDSAERLLQGWADRLGMTTQARHELGLKDAQRRALRWRRFDPDKLPPEVRVRVRQLADELELLVAEAVVE